MKIKKMSSFFVLILFVFFNGCAMEEVTQGVKELDLEYSYFKFICTVVGAKNNSSKMELDLTKLPEKIQKYISFFESRCVKIDNEKILKIPYMRFDLLVFEMIKEFETDKENALGPFDALDVIIFDKLLQETKKSRILVAKIPEDDYIYTFLQYAIVRRNPLAIIEKILKYYPDIKAPVQKLNTEWLKCSSKMMLVDTKKTALTLAKKRIDVMELFYMHLYNQSK
jgi:hypothetical protein